MVAQAHTRREFMQELSQRIEQRHVREHAYTAGEASRRETRLARNPHLTSVRLQHHGAHTRPRINAPLALAANEDSRFQIGCETARGIAAGVASRNGPETPPPSFQ
ncbi:hypothetical protein HK100_001076 [Physocladia obscura]|uniref:Uncharacterized protein n=1 Tax=Physocladia obscura TaxID=109957 RepID=A0AAD5TA71_9FUNG|nr:hypothetical protein HK100_001076 [Physocladia obscura]